MIKFESYKTWVNEKFTEDSDPISDLKIGVNARIKKYLKDVMYLDSEKKIKEFHFGNLFGYNAILAWLASEDKTYIIPDLLVSGKVSPKAQESFALRWASAKGNVDMIKLFIEYGADPNDTEGANSLDCAIMYQKMDAVKYLISIGAKITDYSLSSKYLENIKLSQDVKDELVKNKIKNK